MKNAHCAADLVGWLTFPHKHILAKDIHLLSETKKGRIRPFGQKRPFGLLSANIGDVVDTQSSWSSDTPDIAVRFPLPKKQKSHRPYWDEWLTLRW
jgi:hypothetical protein